MKKNKKLILDKEMNDKAIEAIKKFFKKERDEEIGDLAAILMMDFFTDKLAPIYYNKGIKDAVSYMNESVEDMYELEIV